MRALALIVCLAACGGHRHGPNRADDPSRLYVEVFADNNALDYGTQLALQRIRYVVPTNHNGDVELKVEKVRVDNSFGQTVCSVKILALRLPQHDLLGIADASGRTRERGRSGADNCLTTTAQALVRGKVRVLLDRMLRAKR